MHLFHKVVNSVEFFFTAQPGNEVDVNVLAINILIKIEDVHLEQRLRTFECWPGAYTGYRIERTPVLAGHAYREYPHYGTLQSIEIDVRGRITKRTAQALPFDDFA